MKYLADIVNYIAPIEIIGDSRCAIASLVIDSRKVSKDSCFIAIVGNATDGHLYIESCIAAGAMVIVCQYLPENLHKHITYVLVKDTSYSLGLLANAFYDFPSSKLNLIGVTGTNGKTSVATLLFRLFGSFGFSCGLLSTVQNQINDKIIPATHTTPDAVSLNALLAEMVITGCDYCFMEVSSHAIHQHRIAGLTFAGGIFTNITHDHLDYHKTFDNYIAAKKMFFDSLPKEAFALSNADDKNGMVMLQNTKAKKYFYAVKTPADYKIKVVDNSLDGLQLDINGVEVYTRLIGIFNAYNIACVYAVADILGFDKIEILTKLSAIAPPEGRFDQIISQNEKITAIVDYAHTPDALKNVLQTIEDTRKGNEKIITIMGCGGDRDKAKRPVMAQVSVRYSTLSVFTADNPRSENPATILSEMIEGVDVSLRKKVLTIEDRREAIKTACMLASKGDILLIAGKGHEKYQEINGVKTPFDDKQVVEDFFKQLDK